MRDCVKLVWVRGRKPAQLAKGNTSSTKAEIDANVDNLPPDAPIVMIVCGLNCYSRSLPGTSLYEPLLKSCKYRVVVYEKRGVGPVCPSHESDPALLMSPCFHLFGHPSDLHV